MCERRIGSGLGRHTTNPKSLPSLICLHESMQICASNIAGIGPSGHVVTDGAYVGERRHMPLYPKETTAPKTRLQAASLSRDLS